MKKIKSAIIILAIFVVILLIMIFIINSRILKNDSTENYESDSSGDFIKSFGLVNDYSAFFSLEKMLNNYIVKAHYENKEAIYNLLDKDYIEKNKITQDNVFDYVNDFSEYEIKAVIRNIYSQENAENAIYYIEATIKKENEGQQFYFILYQDDANITYSISPIDKQTFESIIKAGEQELNRKEIEQNQYNKSIYINPTEEEIVKKYFEDFLENAVYYPEYTYDLLNVQMKETCFQKLQDFKEYLETKKELYLSYDMTTLKPYGEFNSMDEYLAYLAQAKNLELKGYQIRRDTEYDRYICLDSEGNYYTFYATSPLKYTVVLGDYAIPTDNFIEEYNKSTKPERVVLNIKRFFMGIDDKNYGYSYSVLSESFKNNKYATKEAFVEYVKNNFFEENEIEYISYEEENGLYIYKIKITDATGKSSKEKTLNMIVKLNSGTDFEMSFGEE